MNGNDKVIPVKVALRIRPLVPREEADACAECLRTIEAAQQVILGKDKSFTYDYVFSKTAPQIEVYESCVQPLLNSLFKGYNCTVLAYGQTGSGKTFTMGSACSPSTDNDHVGVIPRVLNDLFRRIEDCKDIKFTVKVSFVEIYNEEIKDLLNNKQSEPLNIREENNTIKVVNLSEVQVQNAIVTRDYLEKGSANRVVGGTAMNDQSSRSHAIFTITLEQLYEIDNHLIKSKFHLVDLAGSERQSKTKAEGLRLKEGININLGLLALGNVISILGEDNPTNKIKYVPYRESKLTRLLQDSLGGNSHTLMIACVSPADSNMEETLNTLRYADRARKIKNKPIVNIDPQAAELQSLRQQVQELKTQLYQLTGGTLPNICIENASEINTLKEDNERLKNENMKLASELQRLIHINRITYEKMSKLEVDKEEYMKKFNELKEYVKNCFNNTNNQNEQQNDTSINQKLIDDLNSKLGDFEKLTDNNDKESTNNELNNDLNDENAPVDKDYALRQAKMQIQLTEYDTELFKKQQLHQQMLESTSQYGTYMSKYESCVNELKQKVDLLEKEKVDLQDLLKQGDVAKKTADQRRDRLRSLESEVLELKKKEKEFQKMIKLREENEKHCEKLRQEIVHIKQERVKLIKQMKADTEAFRKYKQEKEKEVNQLKAIERKHLVEITKLQEGNNRQEAILRRKNEEITRIQKQLRETCEKQKQVAEKRQMAFDRKDSSSMGEKLRQWISQEIEVSVGLAEGRITLNKLIDERKELAIELAQLQEKLKTYKNTLAHDNDYDCDYGPSNKLQKRDQNATYELDTTYVANKPTNNELNDNYLNNLKDKIQNIKSDIECKNTQINEIQQMVIEGDQDEKTKHMFNSLHGMIEAKVLLKHLYNLAVHYLLDVKQKQIQYEISSNGFNNELKDWKKKYEVIEEDFNKTKKNLENQIDSLTRFHEDKILCLLKTKVDENSSDERFRILAEQINNLERKFNRDDPSTNHLKDLTNREDAKKSAKLRREMRKTRIIRKISIDDLQDNVGYEPIAEASPSCDSPMVENDNKETDPDWSKTPLRVKRTSRNSTKRISKLKRSSKSSSLFLKPNENSPNNVIAE